MSLREGPVTRSLASKLEVEINGAMAQEGGEQVSAVGQVDQLHTSRLTVLEGDVSEIKTALADISGFIQGHKNSTGLGNAEEAAVTGTSHVPATDGATAHHGAAGNGTADSYVRPASRHFAKPQEYDGSVPWQSYKLQFETIAVSHKWDNADRIGELVACLKGPALEVFAHLPKEDQLDYDRLVNALDRRVGQSGQAPWFKSQFRRRLRGLGETLAVLARDLERLVALAYPVACQSLRDSLACDQFLGALADVDLQIAVRQSRPTNLQDALSSALEIEAIRRSAGIGSTSGSAFSTRQAKASGIQSRGTATGSSHAIDPALEAILDRLKVLEAAIACPDDVRKFTTNEKRQTPQRFSKPDGCWHCGQSGHIRRFCQQRTQGQRTQDKRQGNE